MKRFLIWSLAVILIVGLGILAAAAVVLNTPQGAHGVARSAVLLAQRSGFQLADFPVKQVRIGGVQSNLWSHVTLRSVQVDFGSPGETVPLQADRVRLSSPGEFLPLAPVVILELGSFQLAASDIEVKNLNVELPFVRKVDFKREGIVTKENLTLERLTLEPYWLAKGSAAVWCDPSAFHIKSAKADFYKGVLTGSATIGMQPPFAYEAAVELKDLDLAEMQSVQAALFENASGRVSGSFKIRGKGSQVEQFEVELSSVGKGGTFNASLIQPLLGYLPKYKNDLITAELSKSNVITYERARIHVTQKGPLLYFMDIAFYTPTYNVDLAVKVDVRMDREQTLRNLQQLLVNMQ